MARRRIKINVGKQGFDPGFPASHSYVANMQAQSKAMTDALLDVLNQLEWASEDIMLEALEPTFELSKTLCPVDTGKLIESGYLEKTSFRGKPRVELGYARGGSPWYAVLVHERPVYHAEPTTWKWLQKALDQDFDNIWGRIVFGYQSFMGTR